MVNMNFVPLVDGLTPSRGPQLVQHRCGEAHLQPGVLDGGVDSFASDT